MVAFALPVSSTSGDLVATIQQASYAYDALPFRRLNRLSQERRTYEDIEDLADQFASRGWLEPPLVAVLTPGQTLKYIEYVNRVFSSDHTIGELQALTGRPTRYAIVIAGHRRTLASQALWNVGCSWCRQEYGEEPPGACFQRHLIQWAPHLVDDQIDVKRFDGIDPHIALLMQCSENGGIRRPPAHESADALDRQFAVLKADMPDLTAAAFARAVKVRPEIVRRSVRFCRLPDNIRSDVETGLMAFGVALELGRLADHGASQATIDVQHRGWLIQRPTVAAATREVDALLSRLTNRMSFDGMGDEDILPEVKRAQRKPFEQKLVNVIHAATPVFRRAKRAFASGDMGLPDSIFLDTTVMTAWRETIETMQNILPDLRQRPGSKVSDHDAEVLAEVASHLDRLMPEKTGGDAVPAPVIELPVDPAERQIHPDSEPLFAVGN